MFRRAPIRTALTALASVTTLTAVTAAGFSGLPGAAHADQGASGQASAGAPGVTHDRVVSDDPVNNTPHVLDGRVKAVVEVGNTVVLGGEFTQVASPDRSQEYERTNLVAFDADTGAIDTDFAPTTDGEVNALQVADDGESVYVGGMFDEVNGEESRGVARLDLADGSPTDGFSAPAMNGRVKDILVRDQKLWVAGTFAYIADRKQPGLATLDPETGAFDTSNRVQFADPYRGGVLQVLNIEIDSAGETLVAAGNFGTVEGESRPQVTVLDIAGDQPQLTDWHTDFYSRDCSANNHTYLRGVTIDPDGEYVAFSTTGAWKGEDTPCDTVARFELDGGADQDPTWVNHSGGDTFHAIAATGTALYAGGHFRWQNNPNTPTGHDAGPGAIEREGLSALDPESGIPYSWNPGRTLGVGVFDMLPTDDGLWITSDTDRVGDWEFHGRVARFPLDGGTTPPATPTPQLPGEVHTRAVPEQGEEPEKLKPLNTDPFTPADEAEQDELERVLRPYDGQQFGTEVSAPSGGLNWDAIHGGFMLGQQLYLAREGNALSGQQFDGDGYGDPRMLDASDQLIADRSWQRDIDQATGMAGADGHVYYTLQGESGLFSRGLNTESGAIGAARQPIEAGDVDFSDAAGLFVTEEHLYWGSSEDGKLRRAEFTNGELAAGSVQVVSGPETGDEQSLRWDTPGMFLLDTEYSENQFTDGTSSGGWAGPTGGGR